MLGCTALVTPQVHPSLCSLVVVAVGSGRTALVTSLVLRGGAGCGLRDQALALQSALLSCEALGAEVAAG